MNPSVPDISVVVLAYRSGDTIASFVQPLIASLEEVEPNWEIILVGNYMENSGDSTPQVVRALAEKHPRIRAVTEVKQGMMGWDMRAGLEAARGKTLAVIDGDNQMPYADVVRVYQKMRAERLDLVKTYRVRREDGPYRRAISACYNNFFKILFPGLKSRDINSKPKIMSRRVYQSMDLTSNGWFIDAEIMIQARRLNLRIGEVATHFQCLYNRPSFVKPLAILEFFGNLIWSRIREFRFLFKKKTPPIRETGLDFVE